MMRRRRIVSALLALVSLTAAAQAQQFVAPSTEPSPLPSYSSNAAPVWNGQPPPAAALPAYLRQDANVVPATAQTELGPEVRTGAVFVPTGPENASPPQPPTSDSPSPVMPLVPIAAYGVEDLVQIALNANPIMRREQARIEQAMGERLQAGLYDNPDFFTNNPQIFGGRTSFVNFGYKQNVVVKGKRRLEKAAADQLVRRTTADYRLERAELMTDVRQQFYTTLAAKHRVHLAQHLTMIAQRGVTGARQLEKAGEGTLTDVLLLDTEFQRAQIRLQNAETTFQGELKELAAVVGVPGLLIHDVTGTLFDVPPQFNEPDVQAFIAENSSYAERARADLTQKQIELRRAEVEPYPDLQIGPHFNTGTVAGGTQYWFTVEFLIPCWNLNQGNIRRSSAEVHKSLAQRQVTRNELSREVSELFAEHRAARDRAEVIRTQILPNAQEAQHLIQEAYVKRVFNVNRLLKSQQNLAAVSSDYFDAAEKAWTTAAELAGMLQLEQFP